MFRRSFSKPLFSAALATGLVLGVAACAQAADVKKTLDTRMSEVVNGWGDPAKQLAGLSAIRMRGGEVVYEYHSGEHGLERPGVAQVSSDSKVRIASISKFFAALGAMKLVEEGRLDLGADVSDYLGFALRNPAYPDQPITVRMLMDHTSSIRDGNVYSIPASFGLTEFFGPEGAYWEDGAHFAGPSEEVSTAPGDFFRYSNLNFGVLGTVIERVTGARFDSYMVDAVFAPLGIEASFNPIEMTDAALAQLRPLYRPVDGQWVAQVDDLGGVRPEAVLTAHNPDGDDSQTLTLPLTAYEVGTNGTIFSPQGGMCASARDLARLARLARLAQLMMNGGSLDGVQIVNPETVALMETPTWGFDGGNGHTYWGLMQEYGLSVHWLRGVETQGGSDIPIAGYERGLRGHAGEAYGLLSGLYCDSATGDAYIYLITGTPNLDDNYGSYSSFYNWEEAILSILNDA